MNEMKNARIAYLDSWCKTILEGTAKGTFTKTPVMPKISKVAGPRAGALLIQAGLQTGSLLQAFSKDQGALLRQTIPFSFDGDPIAFMQSRYLRLECGWPKHLAETMVRLKDLGQAGRKNGRWIVGLNEQGAVVSVSLSDNSPHFLVAGCSGSGKSVALRSAVLQLADGHNQIILADGKRGSSLGIAQHLPGIVGPVAYLDNDIIGALGFAYNEMINRYDRMAQGAQIDQHLVVVFDEFQEYSDNQTVTGLMAKIAAQGRGARVHLMASTQHPTVSAFGESSTRRELTGRLALTVTDASASQVVIGDSIPRADHLLGCGDGYAIVPGACHRVQGAYVDEMDFHEKSSQEPGWLVSEWPDFQPENIGRDVDTSTVNQPTNEQLALAVLSAAANEGRPTFEKRCAENGVKIGSTISRRLHKQGKELWQILEHSAELKQFCQRLNGE